jgi:hypothetical protein
MRMMRVLLLILPLTVSALAAEGGTIFTWGVRLSTPQLLSASGGYLIGRDRAPRRGPDDPPPTKMFIPSGLLVQAEPGIGGGKIGVGYVKGLPNLAAGGVKAFYMRTWLTSVGAEKNRDYVGVEGDATFFMKVSLGVMRSVGHGPRDTRVTAGVGIGF